MTCIVIRYILQQIVNFVKINVTHYPLCEAYWKFNKEIYLMTKRLKIPKKSNLINANYQQGGSSITSGKTYDYQVDNIKAIIIFLVVFGHVITSMVSESDLIRGTYLFIYFFHMPVMVYISGYLSKNLDKIRETAFVSTLVPYMILNVFFYVLRGLILGEEVGGFRFFYPLRGLWYLLALFLWKLLLKDLLKIKYLLVFSILLGLFSGFTREFSSYMTLGRLINMLPFFLLGYYSNREKHWNAIRKIPKVFSVIVIVVTAGISAYLTTVEGFKKSVLFLRDPYPQDDEINGLLMRVAIYIIAAAMIGAFINLTSTKKTWYTEIGSNTLTVYIIHLFIVIILEKFEILNDHPMLYIPYAIVMSIVIVYLCSRPVVRKCYDYIMGQLASIIIKKDKTIK